MVPLSGGTVVLVSLGGGVFQTKIVKAALMANHSDHRHTAAEWSKGCGSQQRQGDGPACLTAARTVRSLSRHQGCVLRVGQMMLMRESSELASWDVSCVLQLCQNQNKSNQGTYDMFRIPHQRH